MTDVSRERVPTWPPLIAVYSSILDRTGAMPDAASMASLDDTFYDALALLYGLTHKALPCTVSRGGTSMYGVLAIAKPDSDGEYLMMHIWKPRRQERPGAMHDRAYVIMPRELKL